MAPPLGPPGASLPVWCRVPALKFTRSQGQARLTVATGPAGMGSLWAPQHPLHPSWQPSGPALGSRTHTWSDCMMVFTRVFFPTPPFLSPPPVPRSCAAHKGAADCTVRREEPSTGGLGWAGVAGTSCGRANPVSSLICNPQGQEVPSKQWHSVNVGLVQGGHAETKWG